MCVNNNMIRGVPSESRFTSYEMTQFILKALALEDETKSINAHTFKMHGYGGSLNDLFLLVDELATAEGKIDKIVCVPSTAWGAPGCRRSPGEDTNLNYAEIDLFTERVYFLINQMVIAPGYARDISTALPYIHVTEYGKKCIAEHEILPYDSEGFVSRIEACSNHDDWDVFYIDQTLKCFNNALYNSATMMLGLEGEYYSERIIDEYLAFLDRNDQSEKVTFENALNSCRGISQKYQKYCESLARTKGKKDQTTGQYLYPDLKSLSPRMDDAANQSFMNYLRLTRNENDHPSGVKMDPSETMLLIVSFLKYYEAQNQFINFFKSH